MSYRTLHKANESYEMAVLWLLLGAFLLAVALMFVHPFGAIVVFWVGLIVAAVAWAVEGLFRVAERRAARRALAIGTCPNCGATLDRQRQPDNHERCCTGCEAVFLDTGTQLRSATETAVE